MSPEQFGMESEMIHTACYRGFISTYEITDDGLYLKEFTIKEKDENYLPIDGVLPKKEDYLATYEKLNHHVDFTGKIRLAKDFIQDLYIHMGYQKASAFETVLDISFENGKVVEINERSKEIEKKREEFKKRYESGDMFETTEEAFSLDMDLE